MTDRLTYVGRRLQGSVLRHTFREEDGTQIFYPKVKRASAYWGLQIGGIYDVPEGWPTSWSSIRSDRASQEDIDRWEAQDRAAELVDRDRKLKRTSDLEAVLDRLRKARASIPPQQRVAFDAWVLSSIK